MFVVIQTGGTSTIPASEPSWRRLWIDSASPCTIPIDGTSFGFYRFLLQDRSRGVRRLVVPLIATGYRANLSGDDCRSPAIFIALHSQPAFARQVSRRNLPL